MIGVISTTQSISDCHVPEEVAKLGPFQRAKNQNSKWVTVLTTHQERPIKRHKHILHRFVYATRRHASTHVNLTGSAQGRDTLGHSHGHNHKASSTLSFTCFLGFGGRFGGHNWPRGPCEWERFFLTPVIGIITFPRATDKVKITTGPSPPRRPCDLVCLNSRKHQHEAADPGIGHFAHVIG